LLKITKELNLLNLLIRLSHLPAVALQTKEMQTSICIIIA